MSRHACEVGALLPGHRDTGRRWRRPVSGLHGPVEGTGCCDLRRVWEQPLESSGHILHTLSPLKFLDALIPSRRFAGNWLSIHRVPLAGSHNSVRRVNGAKSAHGENALRCRP